MRILFDPGIPEFYYDTDDGLLHGPGLGGTGAGAIGCTFDGNGAAIAAGSFVDLRVPFDCEIDSVSLLADQVGDIVIDIRKDVYASYPPDSGDSICALALPEISGDDKSEDATLTGWDTSIAAGSTIRFYVDSCADIQRCTLTLAITKS